MFEALLDIIDGPTKELIEGAALKLGLHWDRKKTCWGRLGGCDFSPAVCRELLALYQRYPSVILRDQSLQVSSGNLQDPGEIPKTVHRASGVMQHIWENAGAETGQGPYR